MKVYDVTRIIENAEREMRESDVKDYALEDLNKLKRYLTNNYNSTEEI